jgi:hypothetical protein
MSRSEDRPSIRLTAAERTSFFGMWLGDIFRQHAALRITSLYRVRPERRAEDGLPCVQRSIHWPHRRALPPPT